MGRLLRFGGNFGDAGGDQLAGGVDPFILDDHRFVAPLRAGALEVGERDGLARGAIDGSAKVSAILADNPLAFQFYVGFFVVNFNPNLAVVLHGGSDAASQAVEVVFALWIALFQFFPQHDRPGLPDRHGEFGTRQRLDRSLFSASLRIPFVDFELNLNELRSLGGFFRQELGGAKTAASRQQQTG